MNETIHGRVARRLKARREELGMSQEHLAREMGFNNRQTLAAIETGRRRIQPRELAAAARVLDVSPDHFTDPYSAVGEASFSFRAVTNDPIQLAEFERLAGGWIATYQTLGMEEGVPPSYLTPALALSPDSSYEAAQAAAEQVRRRLGVGRFPALDLELALEREWGILVLYVDAPEGISGAASRLHGLQAILINRKEPLGRRNYDLAHELFHLLTWDSMPPPRIDPDTAVRGTRRIEELANNFASALLMPRATVQELWEARADTPLTEWLALAAAELRVSGPALKWRLVNLGYIAQEELPTDAEIVSVLAGRPQKVPKPQLFNASFVQRVHSAVESGLLSLRKASRLLGLDTAAFAGLCQAYGRQISYEI
jgi:XRE family transcriptional regulator, fatty acid utilization regulator